MSKYLIESEPKITHTVIVLTAFDNVYLKPIRIYCIEFKYISPIFNIAENVGIITNLQQ